MELLKRFTQGDIQAFEELFRQHQSEIYGWILRIVRDPAAADDLTVETLWRVFQARARFDPEASFGAWARRIATNLAIDHLRLRRPVEELPEEISQGPPPNPALQREMREQIQCAFRRLPARLQAAATLALIEERSYDEIAGALGISVIAVRLRMFRAVRILRKELMRMGVKP